MIHIFGVNSKISMVKLRRSNETMIYYQIVYRISKNYHENVQCIVTMCDNMYLYMLHGPQMTM